MADSKTPTGLNLGCIGKTYQGPTIEVTHELIRDYALASNDPNPWYVDVAREGGVVAPIIFPVRLVRDVLFMNLGDPETGIDLMRLVHGEQEMQYQRLLRPGDVVATDAEILSIDVKGSGDVMRTMFRGLVDGEPVVEAIGSFFIRGKKKKPAEGEAPKPKKPAPVDPAEGKELLFEIPTFVTKDQTYRYADASGDHNPIHVNEEFAKMAGLPGIILQGLCTMAFASSAIVNGAAGGDPTRVASMANRFASPVLPGDLLTTVGWREEGEGPGTHLGFVTKNQSGTIVLTNGRATLADG